MDAEHSALVARQHAEMDEALKTLCMETAEEFGAMSRRHDAEHRALREKYNKAKGE
jgi:hypothetical protein